jgi:hypothetical protein
MLWPVLVPVAEIRFSVRGYLSLRLAKTEGTRKLQAETRPNSRPPPRPPPSGHGWWRLARPSCRCTRGKKKLIRTTGGHGRTRVSWATHQRAVASPIRDGTEHNTTGSGSPHRTGMAWLGWPGVGGMNYGDARLCLPACQPWTPIRGVARQGIMECVGLRARVGAGSTGEW